MPCINQACLCIFQKQPLKIHYTYYHMHYQIAIQATQKPWTIFFTILIPIHPKIMLFKLILQGSLREVELGKFMQEVKMNPKGDIF